MVKNNLSEHIANTKVFKTLTSAEQKEIDLFESKIAEMENQFFIKSTTISIESYENDYGLPVDSNKSIDERRAIVLAKMRGQGVCTPFFVENAINAFGGYARIEEKFNNYYFLVKYDLYDTNVNWQDIYRTIQSIKPVHLGFDVIFLEVTNYGYTMDSNIARTNLGITGKLGTHTMGGGLF